MSIRGSDRDHGRGSGKVFMIEEYKGFGADCEVTLVNNLPIRV